MRIVIVLCNYTLCNKFTELFLAFRAFYAYTILYAQLLLHELNIHSLATLNLQVYLINIDQLLIISNKCIATFDRSSEHVMSYISYNHVSIIILHRKEIQKKLFNF